MTEGMTGQAGRTAGGSGSERIWTAALIIIGDEILSGRTQDKNLAFVAKWLNVQGIRLSEVRVVPDRMEAIVVAVRALSAAHDYVFTTGGIGPTHDDITIDAVAEAVGRPVVINPRAEEILREHYGDRITPARLRMARTPEGAELIETSSSGAPGVRVDNLFLLAGVPAIARAMLAGLDGRLEGGRPVLQRTVGAWVAESQVAELLEQVEKAHPGSQIGSYPFWSEGRVGANFVIRTEDPQLLAQCTEALLAELTARGIAPHDGEIEPARG
jgi:molybdenum cofactor synthesis domain-containing protein